MLRSLLLLGLLAARAVTSGQHPLNIVRESLYIPLRDGVRLYAIVYRPEREEKFPVIVYRTPYGAEKYDGYAEFPLKAAKQGYVVCIVDVRGRYKSDGVFEAYRNEKNDGYDVIEWAGKKYPYSNGKVGTYGGSYPGFVQWLAMSQSPPSLTAAAPDMTPIHSHQFFYVGGAFSFGWLEWFYTLILPNMRERAGDTTGTWETSTAAENWQMEKEQWNLSRPLTGNPFMSRYVPYYDEWLLNPDRTSYWDFANAEKDFSAMPAPALIHTGWYDAVYGLLGATEGFSKIRTEPRDARTRERSRLIIGPWNHTTPGVRKTKFGSMENGRSAGLDFDRLLIGWFDAELKDVVQPGTPPVSIFIMGENRWRYENEWPPRRAVATDFYLHERGVMDNELPAKEKPDQYMFDPRSPLCDSSYQKPFPYDQRGLETRSDVVVYTSGVLEEDLEVTGRITLEVFVSSTARDTDFSFTLCDVFPDGTSLNLASLESGYLRMRYRNGFTTQELMEPGSIYNARIDNYFTSNLFRKGHRIRVSITSSKFPHYDVNPNTGDVVATETKMVNATQRIYHDAKYPSRLILPVIPR
jgi:uncharacterized protein